MARRIGAAGLALVKQFEGFEPKWYRDPVGIWTIGYGHTDAAGQPRYAASKSLVLTEAEATDLLRRDLQKYADTVSMAVKVPLTDNQFDALVSWCYNVGQGAVTKSTLVRKLNAGDYASVPAELARWNKAKGKVLKGLTRRRAAEADLWLSGSATDAPKHVPAPQDRPKPQREPAGKTGGKAGLAAVIAIALAMIGAIIALIFGD